MNNGAVEQGGDEEQAEEELGEDEVFHEARELCRSTILEEKDASTPGSEQRPRRPRLRVRKEKTATATTSESTLSGWIADIAAGGSSILGETKH